MRPILYRDPETGEERQAYYNDRNLLTDKDYEDAGLEYISGKGWYYRID